MPVVNMEAGKMSPERIRSMGLGVSGGWMVWPGKIRKKVLERILCGV